MSILIPPFVIPGVGVEIDLCGDGFRVPIPLYYIILIGG